MKKLLLGLLVFTMIFSVNAHAGTTLSDLQNKQNQVGSQLNASKSKVNKLKNQKKNAVYEANKLDRQIDSLTDQIKNYNSKISNTKQNITELEVKIKEEEAAREKYNEEHKDRLKKIYMAGKVGYVQTLLKSKGADDFLKRTYYTQKMVEYDNGIVKEMIDVEEKLKDNKLDLVNKKNEIEKLNNSKKQAVRSQQNSLSKKLTYIKQVNSDIEEEEKKYKALMAENEAIKNEIKAYKSKLTYNSSGMVWPVPGYSRISSPYGMRIHPISKKKRMHTGIDIPAAKGKPVVSADDGVVITARWSNSYGKLLLVDHGVKNGVTYTTKYAHNSAFKVSNGQKVKKGQTIALIGTTGWSTGNHLHFEVLLNNKDQNPLKYVPRP
ncbi:MAG: peptidoglycan DD-metalloendopeptidase family protein [Clostridia bacterium]|jgi:murein DD-endopeptidase MepM/ murein hydrolase activator NlpD|nr:peptidoglycan DD-metalloendopeptidase family protein [Clostridia bacterium]